MIDDSATATEIVAANCSNRRPVNPGVKAAGTNTARRTSVVAMTGAVTSSIALRVASGGLKPSARWSLHILDNDNRVVDHHADGEDQPEQS